MTTFQEMMGKTIVRARRLKLKGCDDNGFLRLDFTDGSHAVIEGGYGGYTGDSEDEYKTCIGMCGDEREAKLEEESK
jgi:hypothetical protein